MPVEMLTYAILGERLNCSPEAARALVKRLRLPRQKANDGKVLVSIDLSEINHKPLAARSLGGAPPITATLKARIEALQAELIKVGLGVGTVSRLQLPQVPQASCQCK